jgi:thymidylate synthase
MNNLDKTYTALLQDILDNGVEKKDRTGTGTLSVFGRQIRHKMSEGFPLLTTKKMYMKGIVIELLWFLKGDTNIKYLVDNDCHIWDGDCYSNYGKKMVDIMNIVIPSEFMDKGWVKVNSQGKWDVLTQEEFINKIKTDDEFAEKWGELGPVYGKQWRKWRGQDGMIGKKDENGTRIITWNPIDQIANLINDLKTNPDSRRLMVNAWNVGELDQMVLPPCHYGFQIYTRELTRKERWEWLRKKCWGKSQILWDRMAIPPHEWLDKASVIHSLEYPIDFGKVVNINIPRRAISLMWNQRSVDTFLGLPFNIASYGLLLEIIAKEVNMVPDELIGNLGDVHLYSNHIEQAKEQIGRELTLEERKKLVGNKTLFLFGSEEDSYDEANIPKRTREPFPLPTLKINTEFWQTESGECGVGPLKTNLQGFEISDFVIENYQSHTTIKAPLSN